MGTTAGEGIETCFTLDNGRRKRLLSGDHSAMIFEGGDRKPYGCERGATYVLTWSRQARSAVGEVVISVPRTATSWITITDVRRHRRGGWMVRFDVIDRRERIRFLRRTPPVIDPHAKDDGKAESSYTTSRWAALDELEVVPDEWQQRRSREASQRDHALRMVAVGERKRQMWRRKRKRNTAPIVEDAA